jgi:hypothetical protein
MIAGDAMQVVWMVEVEVKHLHNHLHQMTDEILTNEHGDLRGK